MVRWKESTFSRPILPVVSVSISCSELKRKTFPGSFPALPVISSPERMQGNSTIRIDFFIGEI